MDTSVKQQSRWDSSEKRRVSRNQSYYITITKEGENILVIHYKFIEHCVGATMRFVSCSGLGNSTQVSRLLLFLLQEASSHTWHTCHSWRWLINKVTEQQYRCWVRSLSWREELIRVSAGEQQGSSLSSNTRSACTHTNTQQTGRRNIGEI